MRDGVSISIYCRLYSLFYCFFICAYKKIINNIADIIADLRDPDLLAALGRAYTGLDSGHSLEDIDILRELLGASDPWIAGNTINAIRNVAKNDPRLALDLLKGVDIGLSNRLCEQRFFSMRSYYATKMVAF